MPPQRPPAIGDDVSHLMGDDGLPAIGADVSHLFVAPKPRTRPVSAEDFTPAVKPGEKDWFDLPGDTFAEKLANVGRFLGGEAKGFAKGAARSALDVGQMAIDAGIVPGQTPSGFNASFQNPTLASAHDAMAAQGLPEQIGGYLETGAELAAPVAEGAALLKAGAAKAAPAVSKISGAIDTASKIPVVGSPLKGPVNWTVKALSYVLDKAAKSKAAVEASADAAKVALAAERRAPITTTTWNGSPGPPVAPPVTLVDSPLPPGYSMPVMPLKAAPVTPVGRVVPAQEPTLTEVLQQALAESSAPTPPARITTPPAPELLPGYTPRTSAPKPKAAKASLPEPGRAATEKAAPKPPRPYFLKSDEQMAIEKAAKAAPKTEPSGLSIADLPEAWKSKTGQDIFPMTAAQTREVADAFKQEIAARGLSTGQALALVSKNTDLPTAVRSQIMRALTKVSRK